MSAAPLVTVSRDGRVATIRLNRPEKRNALNSALIAAATTSLERFRDDLDTLIIVLTGAGPAFSAGADVQELQSLNEESARNFITHLHVLIDTVRSLPQIVIAAIRGPCLGGALELAAACDLRIAAENARFGMPEVRVGRLSTTTRTGSRAAGSVAASAARAPARSRPRAGSLGSPGVVGTR